MELDVTTEGENAATIKTAIRELMERANGNVLYDFVRESNRIEGIHEVKDYEVTAHAAFLRGPLSVEALEMFVDTVAGAKLRDKKGMNVQVGGHFPPGGGPHIRKELTNLLLASHLTPFERHVRYEKLHPFMDGNGRSGRILWLRDHGGIEAIEGIGFLHRWYYESLQHSRV